MKPAPFEHVPVETVDEAVAALAEHGDEAKVLAGGQSLVPLLNLWLARPAVLVDVNRVRGLDGIEANRARSLSSRLARSRADCVLFGIGGAPARVPEAEEALEQGAGAARA